MLASAGTLLNEGEWHRDRYLCEGICPNCRSALERTGVTAAVCRPCKLYWTSPRIPKIFPSGSIKKSKEIEP